MIVWKWKEGVPEYWREALQPTLDKLSVEFEAMRKREYDYAIAQRGRAAFDPAALAHYGVLPVLDDPIRGHAASDEESDRLLRLVGHMEGKD